MSDTSTPSSKSRDLTKGSIAKTMLLFALPTTPWRRLPLRRIIKVHEKVHGSH
ncbi:MULTISPECIES: hypothetical protein [Psychrobacter]|uniref:hypothetical protein n=1 Tax=Psychrobacter TaxID=497 RepID=UPI00186847E6|nr:MULTISPECIES: hypothetical protein [Psychrobacter]MCG3881796.1 hypothetical protein [Psychrobacter sp. Ps3]